MTGSSATQRLDFPEVGHELREATIAVLRERGFDGLTLERVAEVAGRARSTLWRQGLTREALIRALVGELAADFRSTMYPILTSGGTGRERLVRGLEELCELLDRHLPLMLATDEAFHQETGPGQPPDYLHPFIQFLREAAADGSLQPGDDSSEPPTSPSTPSPGRTSTCAVATDWPAEAGAGQRRRRGPRRHRRADSARLESRERSETMTTMTVPYREPLVPREPGERQIPEPPRRGEPGGPPCGICGGTDDLGRLVGRELDAPSARRRQPPRRGLAREPCARRLVLRPPDDARRGVRPRRRAGRARDSRRSATSRACTSTAGATAAPTSTCGSCRGRSAWSRRRG